MSLGADGIKNGSDYLTDLSLVAAMAASQVPTILSTGMATLAEIDDAVRTFRGAEGDQLVVLHCTSTYPTAMVDVHLRKIPTLAAAFDVAVGLSDHTDGSVAAIGAVALGAVVIEKHFTLDKGLPGPDHHFSADERELAVLVRAVQDAHAAARRTRIGPTEAEEAGRVAFRLSCVAAEDLPAGRRLRVDDIALRRPGSGLPPSGSGWLIGRELLADVPRGHVFATGDSGERPPGAPASRSVRLRPITHEDVDLLFRWRNLPEIVDLSTSQRTVDRSEHDAWFAQASRDPDRMLYIVEADARPVGHLRMERGPSSSATVTIYLLPDNVSQGIGVPALELAASLAFSAGITTLVAHVRQDNERSVRAFQRAGYAQGAAPTGPPPGHVCLTRVRPVGSAP